MSKFNPKNQEFGCDIGTRVVHAIHDGAEPDTRSLNFLGKMVVPGMYRKITEALDFMEAHGCDDPSLRDPLIDKCHAAAHAIDTFNGLDLQEV